MRGRVLFPRVVLICHAEDRVDTEGLTAWLATTMDLVGIVKLNEPPSRIFTRVHHELKRIGWLRFLDVLAFRLYYSLFLARRDARWIDGEIARLHSRYPAVPSGIQIIETTDANSDAVASFLRRLQPDLMLARCKCLLDSKIFNIPTHGTFVLHPGICPEYRNAHGCFWALANRDLTHVGMTMLQVDRGVDTGPVLLQASYSYDELKESHIVVQYRAVLENLEAITDKLFAVWSGSNNPISVRFRKSRTWGQPWLSAYLKWKRAARGARQ